MADPVEWTRPGGFVAASPMFHSELHGRVGTTPRTVRRIRADHRAKKDKGKVRRGRLAGMFEAVRARPGGASTVARYAATAAECGFEGIVVGNADGTDYDTAPIRQEYGIDVVDAVTIDTEDPSVLGGRLGQVRPEYTLVLVEGRTGRIARQAVEDDRVDVLLGPTAGEWTFDDAFAGAASEHGVRVAIDLSPVLRRSGGDRVRALQDLRRLREVLAHAEAPHVVTASPGSHLQVRAPRELVAVGEAVGFDPDAVRAGLREWGELAERNRHRHSESFIEPGVERGPYEEDDRRTR